MAYVLCLIIGGVIGLVTMALFKNSSRGDVDGYYSN